MFYPIGMQTNGKAIFLVVIIGLSFFLLLQPVFAQSLKGNISTECENLTFSDLNITPDSFSDVKVLGMITNNSTQTFEDVIIVAEFYDREGKFSDVNQQPAIFGVLEPGESSPFEVPSSGVGVNESGNITLTCGAASISPFASPDNRNNSTTTMDRYY
jgi:hypothetical protein